LSYTKSLLSSIVAAAQCDVKAVKAPTLCKILKVLNQAGDEVVKGEILMVVGRMKMEKNTTVSGEAVFQTIRSEGETVEGVVLCEVA
jgi:acetyl/propionyl-CoA carboxylase alpha subunit